MLNHSSQWLSVLLAASAIAVASPARASANSASASTSPGIASPSRELSRTLAGLGLRLNGERVGERTEITRTAVARGGAAYSVIESAHTTMHQGKSVLQGYGNGYFQLRPQHQGMFEQHFGGYAIPGRVAGMAAALRLGPPTDHSMTQRRGEGVWSKPPQDTWNFRHGSIVVDFGSGRSTVTLRPQRGFRHGITVPGEVAAAAGDFLAKRNPGRYVGRSSYGTTAGTLHFFSSGIAVQEQITGKSSVLEGVTAKKFEGTVPEKVNAAANGAKLTRVVDVDGLGRVYWFKDKSRPRGILQRASGEVEVINVTR